ncbi:MAG TPA: NUDIX hydrolase [Longimicrobiaceae bacterium]|nr:NUDIX hydrolase [Longimicrobiaceae bacterium]
MARKHGPWTIQETTRKYGNEFIEVIEDEVLQPDGEPGRYATVRMKPGVSILPVDADGIVTLIRQFRYALGGESLEAVSGAVDGDQPPLEAARREAREEAGIEAEEWTDLGRMDIDTSIVHCPVQLFLAQGLTFTETDREGTEEMESVHLPLVEAVRRVMEGEIPHGPSCVLILKAERYLREQGQDA